jgi:hypothetical protein
MMTRIEEIEARLSKMSGHTAFVFYMPNDLSTTVTPDDVSYLLSCIATMRKALEYYAKGRSKYKDDPSGTIQEFGCGCCAGTVESDGIIDPDERVIGKTAREALQKLDEVGK